METAFMITWPALVLSLAANVYLIFKFIVYKPHRKLDYSARELLRQLTSGTAILKIDVLSPDDLFLRRHR